MILWLAVIWRCWEFFIASTALHCIALNTRRTDPRAIFPYPTAAPARPAKKVEEEEEEDDDDFDMFGSDDEVDEEAERIKVRDMGMGVIFMRLHAYTASLWSETLLVPDMGWTKKSLQ